MKHLRAIPNIILFSSTFNYSNYLRHSGEYLFDRNKYSERLKNFVIFHQNFFSFMVKHNLEDRALVQFLAEKNWSVTSISRELNKSRDFVYHWKNRNDIGRKPGSGRPLKLDSKLLSKIEKRLTAKDRPSLRKLASELQISPMTVQRGRRAANLYPYRQQNKPAITKDIRKKRIKFAKDYKNQDWKQVLFVDEKIFILQHQINKKNYVTYTHCRAEVPQIPTVKHPKKINVIAGIGFGGRTELKLFEENMTSELYKEILSSTLLPGAEKVFGDRP